MFKNKIKKTAGKGHIVILVNKFSDSELNSFIEYAKNLCSDSSLHQIHFICNDISDSQLLNLREKTKDFSAFCIEENANPDLLRTRMYPYYAFEQNMNFWETMFAAHKEDTIVYLAFLHDFLWKTFYNVMWPYHYDDTNMKLAKKRVSNLINQIPDEYILNLDSVESFHKFYILGLKTEGTTTLDTLPDSINILRNGKQVYSAKKIEVVLTKFRAVGRKLSMVAFLKSPVFSFCEKPELYVEYNNKERQRSLVPLKKSSWRYYKTKEETNTFYTFVLDMSLKGISSFHFYVKINGTMYDTYYYFMPDVVFNPGLDRYRYYTNRVEYHFERNTFRVNKVTEEVVNAYHQRFQNYFLENQPEVADFRSLILKEKKDDQNIWLYYDCKGVYKDNGYLQFIHDFDKQDGVKRYYILNDDFESRKELFTDEQAKHVISFGSERHKLLYCLCNKVITAYIEKNNYLPFTDAEYANLMDIATMPSIVYLQHGVYHAHIPWKYSLDRLNIDQKVISAKFEHVQNVKNHCFTKKQEIPAMMPRYDFINADAVALKKILYAPSWRKYLVDMVDNTWVTREDIFLNSNFFKETSALLTDPALTSFLKKTGYTLDFKLHPILMRYAHLYNIDSDVIHLAKPSVNDEEYAIFITDFSSYVMDFAYLNRSILYFFPDYEEFRSGMSDYRECVLPFKNGIGEFATDAKSAVSILKKMIRRKGKPAKKFAKKMQDMFYYKDANARERIYQAISKRK